MASHATHKVPPKARRRARRLCFTPPALQCTLHECFRRIQNQVVLCRVLRLHHRYPCNPRINYMYSLYKPLIFRGYKAIDHEWHVQ
eukprot:COSAG01_NODE_4888_length_4649_cov_1923.057582_2_plen_86_part_00